MENMVGQYQTAQGQSPFQVVSSVPLPNPQIPAQINIPNPVPSADAVVSNPVQAVNTTTIPQGASTVQVPNYSGVNIQIFNPSVTAPGATAAPSTVNAPNYGQGIPSCYPPNYYTQNLNQSATQPVQPVQEAGKKKEKREVVVLTDEYIKNLEDYLKSQKREERLMGAREVMARLQEDPTRKSDPALNSLVNIMLQDPYQPVQYLAMGLLDSKAATGNASSVGILQGMQQHSESADPQKKLNSVKATNILLKMSGDTTEKEFEVNEKPKSK